MSNESVRGSPEPRRAGAAPPGAVPPGAGVAARFLGAAGAATATAAASAVAARAVCWFLAATTFAAAARDFRATGASPASVADRGLDMGVTILAFDLSVTDAAARASGSAEVVDGGPAETRHKSLGRMPLHV